MSCGDSFDVEGLLFGQCMDSGTRARLVSTSLRARLLYGLAGLASLLVGSLIGVTLTAGGAFAHIIGPGSGEGGHPGQPGRPYAAPTPGNLMIYRVGTGAGSLVNTGNAVFLDEYTTSGVFVQSIPVPTVAAGPNRPLIASGTASSEGQLARSTDGQFLIFTGYGIGLTSTTSLANTTSSTVPRVIGRLDTAGNLNTTTALPDYSDQNNPRSAASTNGIDLWAVGGAGGVRYAPLGRLPLHW